MAKNYPSIQEKVAKELSAVRKKKLYEEIVVQIQRLIEDDKLKPGDQLPPERELVEIFQVSRHSVREAIRSLEQQNILQSRPGSGTFVVLGDAEMVVDFLAKAVSREKSKLLEIFQFRKMIEPEIAYQAALNRTEDDIAQFEFILGAQIKHVDDPVMAMKLDNDFHLALSKAARNSIVLNILERVNDILGESRKDIYQVNNRAQISIKGHASVLEAIRQGDAVKSMQEMRDHLESIEQIIMSENEMDGK